MNIIEINERNEYKCNENNVFYIFLSKFTFTNKLHKCRKYRENLKFLQLENNNQKSKLKIC